MAVIICCLCPYVEKKRLFRKVHAARPKTAKPAGEIATKIFRAALVCRESFCYMLRRRHQPAYHDAVVAELVDAQR